MQRYSSRWERHARGRSWFYILLWIIVYGDANQIVDRVSDTLGILGAERAETEIAEALQSRKAFQKLGLGIRTRRDIAERAVRLCGSSLARVGGVLQNDRAIVLIAVTEDGMALRYASHALNNDCEVVFTAVASKGLALEFASVRLRGD